MDELGLTAGGVLPWFLNKKSTPCVVVQVSKEHSQAWIAELSAAVRRCYVADKALLERALVLGRPQAEVLAAKLPDPGSVMAGDFGEILVYLYQAAQANPRLAFGPKKWRLKQDRTKPAPLSDVVHFVLPAWPNSSADDVVVCSEVKVKSTDGSSTPIKKAVEDSAKDRTSRLARTLMWLRERALNEDLGSTQLAHLERFINATKHPPATREFNAVAVICSALVEGELGSVPAQTLAGSSVVVISVPNLKDVYMAVFDAVRKSTAAAVTPTAAVVARP